MANLEALQARLKIFQEAGQNLQIKPLVTQQDLVRLGVEYQNCVDLFAQILDRRLPANSIDSDLKQEMILLSGGVLRELIRIFGIKLAIDMAKPLLYLTKLSHYQNMSLDNLKPLIPSIKLVGFMPN